MTKNRLQLLAGMAECYGRKQKLALASEITDAICAHTTDGPLDSLFVVWVNGNLLDVNIQPPAPLGHQLGILAAQPRPYPVPLYGCLLGACQTPRYGTGSGSG